MRTMNESEAGLEELQIGEISEACQDGRSGGSGVIAPVCSSSPRTRSLL
jgi:hypothetical protein